MTIPPRRRVSGGPTARRPIPVGAGLPDWLFSNHPSGLAVVGLSLLFATALFLDGPLYRLGQNLHPTVGHVFRVITAMGDSAWSIKASALLLAGFWLRGLYGMRVRTRIIYRHAATLAGFVLATLLSSGLAVNILKRLIGRARPGVSADDSLFVLQPFDAHVNWASFPSGHATTIFALALALCMIFPRLRLVFLAIAAWVAFSRVMVGAHWMSDVVAGTALGIAATLVLRQRFARRGWAFVWRSGGFPPRLTGVSHLLVQDAGWLWQRLRQAAEPWLAKGVSLLLRPGRDA